MNFLRTMQTQPNLFFKRVLLCRPWLKQQEINRAIATNNRTTIRSCHASGKTWDIARIVLWYLFSFPKSIVLTTAPTWRQVKEIMWAEIGSAYANAPLPLGGKLIQTKLEIDDDWKALGLSTTHPEAFQGFHGRYVLVVVDEASGVSELIYEAIEGVLSGAYVKLVLIGNPTRTTGSFARSFKDPTFAKFHISGFATPNVLANDIVISGLMSPNYPAEMASRWGEDSDIYRVKVLGEFPRAEADTLISVDLIEQAIAREVQPEGTKKMGVDVARYGGNESVILVRQGQKVTYKERIAKSDLMSLVGRIIAVAHDHDMRWEDIVIDSVGVGSGVVDRLKEQGKNVNGVNVGEQAIDHERFANKRAEAYWLCREDMKNLDVPDEDFYQLTTMKYKYNSAGKLLIESKEEMQKRGIESPDVADALMLTYCASKPTLGLEFA